MNWTVHCGPDQPKCKETSNLMWLSLIWFIIVLFLNNSTPQNQIFLFCFTKILDHAFLHDSQLWLWGFFTEYQNIFAIFAIIQSTCYRLIKGEKYLKKMYEIDCDDWYEGMFAHIQSFVIVLKVFRFSVFFIWIGSILNNFAPL